MVPKRLRYLHLNQYKTSLHREIYKKKSMIHSRLFPKSLRILGTRIYNFMYRSPNARYIYPKNSFALHIEETWNSADKVYHKKILIDAQCLQGGTFNRGIGRYSRALVKRLAIQNPEVEFVLLFNDISPMENIAKVMTEVKNEFRNLNLQICEMQLTNGRILERDAIIQITDLVARINPDSIILLSIFEHPFDVIPISHKLKYKTVGVYYDLIPMEYKHIFLANPEARKVYENNLTRLTSLDTLLSISDSSSRSLLEKTKYAGELATINGASFFQSEPGCGLGISERSGVLCVGSDSPHKNISTLILAYAMMPNYLKNIHRLLLVGVNINSLPSEIKVVVKTLEDKVVLMQNISDAELQTFYREVRLTVAPSFIEGLGMPILEAWNEGCVAIGSQNTSLSDIINSKNCCFDPRSPEDLSALMERFLTDETCWNNEQSRLLSRRSEFTWDNVAHRVGEILGLQ